MATTTGVDQQTPRADQGAQEPNQKAVDVPAATGPRPQRPAVQTAEKAHSGRRGRGWCGPFSNGCSCAALVVIVVLAYFLWRV